MNSRDESKLEEAKSMDDRMLESSISNMSFADGTIEARSPAHEKSTSRRFLVNVAPTKTRLLAQEDSDGDKRITIDDQGPKIYPLGSDSSNDQTEYNVQGTYRLSNLLQELSFAEERNLSKAVISEDVLDENPVDRLSRLITWWFWPRLVRRLDAKGLGQMASDTKNQISPDIYRQFRNDIICEGEKAGDISIREEFDQRICSNRIYVSCKDPISYYYYKQLQQTHPNLSLMVLKLPHPLTPEYIHYLRHFPGILGLSLRRKVRSGMELRSLGLGDSLDRGYATVNTEIDIVKEYECRPLVVPGGRFNELYGWDSYFMMLGLLLCQAAPVDSDSFYHSHASNTDLDVADICMSLVEHHVYEIHHYGKILNANRTYYLDRSQPPFLTDMIINVFESFLSGRNGTRTLLWLNDMLFGAMLEYKNVWMSEPRYIPSLGLSRYYSTGMRMPIETEIGHFDPILRPYAEKHGLPIGQFAWDYQIGRIHEPDLDKYFLNDRAMRESGHDTTSRLHGVAAERCTVDLNFLLYKYEVDMGYLLETYFDGGTKFVVGYQLADQAEELRSPDYWKQCAVQRRNNIDKYLWDQEKGFYYDYDIFKIQRTTYESVTGYWALWCRVASPDQCERMLAKFPKFEQKGGLVSGTLESRRLDSPCRQWDYPYGWPPHQILAWKGLLNYGKTNIAHRLAYRWCYMMLCTFTDYNGMVPEKFDVVRSSHKIDVEYGNVGSNFKYAPREGFGWMNSSFQIGLDILDQGERQALEALVPPETLYQTATL